MQTAAITGHPSNARKSERVTCIHRQLWRYVIIFGTFSGVLRILGYLLRLFPDFWVSFFSVQFDFFRNNPDFWVLILIFYFK